MELHATRNHETHNTRMAKVKETDIIKCQQGNRTTLTHTLLGRMQNGITTLTNPWTVSRNFEHRLAT